MNLHSFALAVGLVAAGLLASGCSGDAAKEESPAEAPAEAKKAEAPEAKAETAEKKAPEPAKPAAAKAEPTTKPAAGTPAAANAAKGQAPTAKVVPNPAASPKKPSDEAQKVANAQAERQKKLQHIYEVGRKRDEAAISQLVEVMNSDEEPGIRATAIRVLGRKRIESLVPKLTELSRSKVQPVKIEAAIILYQWGEKELTAPILEELSNQGVALRRAFLTGRKDGKNQYDPEAKKFLSKGLKSDNVYTRLDAALGLYELGQAKTALTVFQDVMKTEDTFYVRMAALNYLRHLKDDPNIAKIIAAAKKDTDERVKKRAEHILAEGSSAAGAKQKPAKAKN